MGPGLGKGVSCKKGEKERVLKVEKADIIIYELDFRPNNYYGRRDF